MADRRGNFAPGFQLSGSARKILVAVAGTSRERDLCFAIRNMVFVTEQGVDRALERDDLDATALQLLATLDGVPAGTGRAVVSLDRRSARIGRVAVLKEARGAGVGATLMRTFPIVPGLAEVSSFELHAQLHAIAFYEALGYAPSGERFLEAGIPHVAMTLLR